MGVFAAIGRNDRKHAAFQQATWGASGARRAQPRALAFHVALNVACLLLRDRKVRHVEVEMHQSGNAVDMSAAVAGVAVEAAGDEVGVARGRSPAGQGAPARRRPARGNRPAALSCAAVRG